MRCSPENCCSSSAACHPHVSSPNQLSCCELEVLSYRSLLNPSTCVTWIPMPLRCLCQGASNKHINIRLLSADEPFPASTSWENKGKTVNGRHRKPFRKFFYSTDTRNNMIVESRAEYFSADPNQSRDGGMSTYEQVQLNKSPTVLATSLKLLL